MSRSKSELLRDWLGLLRSGQYGQTREVLCRVEDGQTGYCCLGVAAEGLFNVTWFTSGNEWMMYYDEDNGEEASDNVLTVTHAKAMGLEHPVTEDEAPVLHGIVAHVNDDTIDPSILTIGDGDSRETWLVHLNDAGFSFNQIADFVQLAGWIQEAETEERMNKLAALTQEMEA
jgi:hypothetical protein